MNESSSRDQTSRRISAVSASRVAAGGPRSCRPRVSARIVPRSPIASTGRPRIARSWSDSIRPSSIACSNAKKLAAKKSAGLHAKNTARRSQRLVQASRVPVVAIARAAAHGPDRRPCHAR